MTGLRLYGLKFHRVALVKVLVELSSMSSPSLRIWHQTDIPIPKHSSEIYISLAGERRRGDVLCALNCIIANYLHL